MLKVMEVEKHEQLRESLPVLTHSRIPAEVHAIEHK